MYIFIDFQLIFCLSVFDSKASALYGFENGMQLKMKQFSFLAAFVRSLSNFFFFNFLRWFSSYNPPVRVKRRFEPCEKIRGVSGGKERDTNAKNPCGKSQKKI